MLPAINFGIDTPSQSIVVIMNDAQVVHENEDPCQLVAIPDGYTVSYTI